MPGKTHHKSISAKNKFFFFFVSLKVAQCTVGVAWGHDSVQWSGPKHSCESPKGNIATSSGKWWASNRNKNVSWSCSMQRPLNDGQILWQICLQMGKSVCVLNFYWSLTNCRVSNSQKNLLNSRFYAKYRKQWNFLTKIKATL